MYDLVIGGGRVIDPAQGIDGPRDVAFKDGRVAALEATIEAGARAPPRWSTPAAPDPATSMAFAPTSSSARRSASCPISTSPLPGSSPSRSR
jgi:hypothetical protein